MNYKRAYQMVLKKVEELEAELEKLQNVNEGNVRLDDRVWELEAQNEALHTALKASGERRERAEAENERLRECVREQGLREQVWMDYERMKKEGW